MRRFEFSEGTSHKFWQVEREGSSLHVSFGRIGTAGQTQTKSFASDDAAQGELDKLVKEKVKKGYAEVGVEVGAAAAAPLPAAVAKAKAAPRAPAPAAPVAAAAPQAVGNTRSAAQVAQPALVSASAHTEPAVHAAPHVDHIAWTDAVLRQVVPSRASELVPRRLPDAKASYTKLAKAMAALAPQLEQGARRDGADVARMKAAREAFVGPEAPGALELEAQAAAFALIGPMTSWDDEARGDDFVRFWWGAAGAEFALRAYAHGSSLHSLAQDGALAIVAAEPSTRPWWRGCGGLGWRTLRRMVVAADGPEHAALMSLAETLLPSASPALRATLATAFEHPAWCKSDLAAMPTGDEAPAWLWPLVVSMPRIDAAQELLKQSQASVWRIARELGDLRFELLARYGVSGGAALLALLEDESAQSVGVDRLRSIEEGVALVVSPEVAAYFVRQLGTTDLRAAASAYLQAHPEVSIAPLAQACSTKGAGADAARAVLRVVAASGHPAVAAAKAALPPAAAELVAAVQRQAEPHAEAAADELPRVLRTPPWATEVKLAPPIVVELTPLPYREALAWRPGEEQEHGQGQYWLEERRDQKDEILAKIMAASASAAGPSERTWNMVSASLLAQVPKDTLLEILPSLDLTRFSWSYYPVALALVARHGVPMIDLALRSASVDSLGAVQALLRADSARAAPLMADAFFRLKKGRAAASEWLSSFPRAAAVGLIPLAVGKPGKLRQAAEAALRFVAVRGKRDVIEAVASEYGDEARRAVQTVLDFDPLLTFPAKLPKFPAFFAAGALTRPRLAAVDKVLPVHAVATLATMLAFTSLEEPYPGIADVKAACEPRSLAEFAWDLFQAWLVAGAPSKEQWAFLALGHLGDDECARKLAPLVRAWPGEAAHARAVLGLDVLARMGTDVSLMHLHGIAQKVKFKGLQEKAREKIDQIAEARGLTAEELADRLVPDLGLDDSGTLWLDFGARRFRVVFDEALKPGVLDDSGKRLPDLPKPKQSDDADKASVAVETWKALKKDAKTIASAQLVRLELAMCAQRRWPADVFRTFLLEHPLLVHVVRRLVWGVYDAEPRLRATFRVAEDSTLASSSDDVFTLGDDARVGILHRLELDDGLAASWGQVFSDYEILQPFAQLSREATFASEDERVAMKLERVAGLKLPTGKVLGLDQRGWRRGPPQDAGVVCWYEKPFENGTVACLDLDPGIFTGMISESPEQTLGALTLSKNGERWGKGHELAFGALSPIAFSELMRDLDGLRS